MNHLLHNKLRRSLSCCAAFVFAGAAFPAAAQTTPTTGSSEPAARAKTELPTTAEVTTGTLNNEDKPLELSPFSVTGEEDLGYRATNTLAGTRLKTNLRDIGAAISVVTEQFLKDTGARNNEDLLVYTVGTEVGGLSGNFGGVGDGTNVSERGLLQQPNNVNRVRGLDSADNTRDYFLSDIPWDSYIVGRVDIQRGPNSILFGLGKPAGIINSTINQAGYQNRNSVETRFGSFGSFRTSLDVNRVILKEELAVRFDALDDRTKFRQDPAYSHDRRIFGALRYDPKFLNKGSAHTTLRVNYEHGNIDSNRPRTLPPADRITPWFQTGTTTVNGVTFNNLNKAVVDYRYNSAYFPGVPGSGASVPSSPNYLPGVSDLFGSSYAFFPDPNSSAQAGPFYLPQVLFSEQYGLAPNGTIDRTIRGEFGSARWVTVGSTAEIAQRLKLPFAAAYKNKAITDPTIFDFYHKLIDGPNKTEDRSFEAFNAVLSQTFWENRAGFEASFDYERYQEAAESLQFPGLGATAGILMVDINTLLPNGTPNPNVGRPMIAGRTDVNALGGQSENESARLTGFGELRAADFLKESWITKLLGRHVFTGSYNRDRKYRADQQWARYALSNDVGGLLRSKDLVPDRSFQIINYLGPDLRGLSSPAGLNLSNVAAVQVPTATQLVLFNSNWNKPTNSALSGYVNPGDPWVNPFNNQTLTQSENPANYVGFTSNPVTILDSAKGDRRLLTRLASKNRTEIESKVFVWQGFLWDGMVVPTFGYRKDTAKSFAVSAPLNSDRYADQSAASYVFPSTPNNTISGTSKSYSMVVYTPKFLREKLPAGINVSVSYNQSSNFQPAAGRIDILGAPVTAPTGKTKDYGIVISAFDDRVYLKVNKFESSSQNASLPPLFNAFLIGFIENRSWISAKRFEAGLTGNPLYEGAAYNYGSSVGGVFVQTAADRALQQQHVTAMLSNLGTKLWPAWQITPTDKRWQDNQTETAVQPIGMTATTDTDSEGYEFELAAQPVKGWDIAINAARTQAVRTNIAGNFAEWIEARNKVFNGATGDLRQSGTNPDSSYKISWNTNFYNNWTLQRLLSGSNATEIRRWRYNVITNYRFSGEKLKGFKVGGAYRWQDKVAIGYPSIKVNVSGTTLDSFDVSKPFFGPSETNVDLWAGYERKFKKINWQIQLNVRNAFGKNDLIPLNAQPDGSAAAFRIVDGPSWTITNRFEF